MEDLGSKLYNEEESNSVGGVFLEQFLNMLVNLVIFALPFVILYFVIAAGVKKGIESSEIGRALVEKRLEKNPKKQ